MKFILDNMIPPRLAQALRALEMDVQALREVMRRDTSDVAWLAEAGRQGWSFVTADRHIRTKPQEREALHHARVISFFLCRAFEKMKFWDQAVWLIKTWPKIENQAALAQRGTSVLVQQNGKMFPMPL